MAHNGTENPGLLDESLLSQPLSPNTAEIIYIMFRRRSGSEAHLTCILEYLTAVA